MKYLPFFVLVVAILITAGCVGGNQNSAVTPTPEVIYVTALITPTPTIITPTITTPVITTPTSDCQCDLSGGCKEVSDKIDKLIGIRQNCAAEMVKRSIEASRGGETNLSYYTSDNPACDAYSSCTNHCIFELQQHYNESCLSGYQV